MRLLLLASLFFISSCSFKSTIINNLPSLLAYRVESKFNIPLESEESFENRVEQSLHLYSKNGEFERIQANLVKLSNGDFGVLKDLFDQSTKIYQELNLEYSPIIAKGIFKMNKEQQEEFLEAYDDFSEDIKERYYLKKLEDTNLYSRYDGFFGDLGPKQENLLEDNLVRYAQKNNVWLKRRLSLKKTILAGFSKQISEADLVKEFVNFNQQTFSPDRFKYYKKDIEIFEQVYQLASKEQRAVFKAKIEEFGVWIDLVISRYKVIKTSV